VEDVLRVTGTCAIPLDEIELRFEPSGGPGGQHANRSRTKVEASFDVAGSPSLDEHHRRRLLDKLGDVVRVSAGESRSQTRNREERRLATKRRRSEIKRQRRLPPGDD
jgi:ribosome-associated protein